MLALGLLAGTLRAGAVEPRPSPAGSARAGGAGGENVLSRADELLNAGQAAQAEVLLQEAMGEGGPGRDPGGAASVELLLRLGVAQSLQAKYAESEATFRAALELAPREPRVPQNLGLLFLRQQRYDEAIQCFQQALDIQPGNPQSNFFIGRIHERRGNREEALRSYIAELNVNPVNGNAWRQYLLLRGDERPAKQAFPWDMLAIWLAVVAGSAALYWLKRNYANLEPSPGFREETEGPELASGKKPPAFGPEAQTRSDE